MLLSTRLARKITVYKHKKNGRAGISVKPKDPSVQLVALWSMIELDSEPDMGEIGTYRKKGCILLYDPYGKNK